ncbi:MAG: TetR/AcrR family transcriptional regulator [Anaerolineaceae bacterium]|nr:TetR/AcrR family transcriptional regulator [Anaerolineaceae bacterium]
MADKKELLLKSAKELFSEQGFKATNVAEITRSAGIATGTYYLYFTSKEQLFMEIFLAENDNLKKEILKDFDANSDPLTAIQHLMEKNINGMTGNPILKEWYNREVFQKIEQKYCEENGLDRMDFMYEHFYKIIETWQAQGKMRPDIPADMIMAVFTAIIVIDERKDEIGLQFFPKIQDHLVDFVMKGLTDFAQQTQE